MKDENRKKMIVGGGIIAAVILILLLSGISSDEKKLASLLNLGNKYISELDYEAAVAVFDKAIAAEPKCEEAYWGKANAQYMLGDLQAAEDTLLIGIEMVDDSSRLEAFLIQIQNEISAGWNAGEDDAFIEKIIGEHTALLLNYTEIKRCTDTEKAEIQLEVLGQNEGKQLSWTSSAPEIADVSDNGLVTCKQQAGYAYIRVSDGRDEAGCSVYIEEPENGIRKESETVRIENGGMDGDIEYISVKILEDDETEEVEGTINNFDDYVYYSGDITIPEALTYKSERLLVTGISAYSYRWCEKMETITIPASIKWFGEKNSSFTGNPFLYCGSLKEIKVDEKNEFFQSVDGVLFSKDGKKLIAYPAGRDNRIYTVPQNVEIIYQGAFAGCRNLEEIQVEAGNTRYESIEGVLMDKTEQTLLAYPVGSGAENYTVPDNIQSIGSEAFYLSEIERVKGGSGLTILYENAFHNCPKLEVLEGIGNVEYLNDFHGCQNLKKMEGGSGNKQIAWFSKSQLELLGIENMSNLEKLYIQSGMLANMNEIGKLSALQRLEFDMNGKELEEQLVDEICKLSNLKELRIDNVKAGDTTEKGMEKLKQKLPECSIDIETHDE